MLDCLPIYHWFHCGNPYSGAQGGMRYLVAPAKKADPADESGKRKIEYLTATIWCWGNRINWINRVYWH